MAMIDYGALVFHNGKIVNQNCFFMDMQDSVGWNDEGYKENDIQYTSLNGNYFAYVGDENATIAFYKNQCMFADKNSTKREFFAFWRNKHHHVLYREFNGMKVKFKRITWNVDEAEIHYKNEIYHVIYGYGIDTNMKVWNRIKCIYCGVTAAKKIDNLILRYTDKKYHTMVKKKYKYHNRCRM